MPKLLRSALCAATACAAALAATSAGAVTFSDASGQYTLGIGPNGELYDTATGVGLRNPAGADYIAPGTPRDSWGVTSNLGSAYADYQAFGTSGVVATTTTTGVNTATLVTTTNVGLSVSQTYSFLSPNIVSVHETVTNIGLTTASDVVFRRNVDFDISPYPFVEDHTSGPIGGYPLVRAATYDAFDDPDPATPFANICSPSCDQTGDLGAGIDIGLGNLAAGQSASVTYFYGINQPGQTLAQLIAEAQADHIAFLIPDESLVNPGAAFLGVGLVPEPSTWAMMLVGMLGLGGALRAHRRSDRRRQALQA